MGNEQLYRESQKMAKDGKILDYPVLSLLTNKSEACVTVKVRQTLSSEEKKSMVNKLGAYCHCDYMEGTASYVAVRIIDNDSVEMKGDLLESVKGLYKSRCISEETYEKVYKDFNPEITADYCQIM
jgi:hypothetical protein